MTTTNLTSYTGTALTFDISGLNDDSTFLLGVESNQVDNSSNLYLDYIVNVLPITTHATTAVVVGQQISLYLWGAGVSLATTPIDDLDGANGSPTERTITHAAIRDSLHHVHTCIATTTTAAQKHYIPPFGVAQYFGGVPPKFWGLFLTHNMATDTLGAGQTALFSYEGIKLTTA